MSLTTQIQKHLTADLLKPAFKGNHPLSGHCYVASEAFYHLKGGKAAGYKPMFIKHENQPHWWIKGPKNEVFDITADQFNTPVPYNKSRGKGFLTKTPCKRTQVLLSRIKWKQP